MIFSRTMSISGIFKIFKNISVLGYLGNSLIPVFCTLSGFVCIFVFLLFVFHHIFSWQILLEIYPFYQSIFWNLVICLSVYLTTLSMCNWHTKETIYSRCIQFYEFADTNTHIQHNHNQNKHIYHLPKFPCAPLFWFYFYGKTN